MDTTRGGYMSNLENPNYYAILPATVRYNKNLKPNEKILFSEISALTNKDGICYASNEYFASLYNVSRVSVSQWISNLEKERLIDREIIYKDNSKEIKARYLRIISDPIKENLYTPIKENLKDNNTSNNNNTLSILSHFSNEEDNENQEQEVQPVRRTDNDYNTTFKAKENIVSTNNKVSKEVVSLSSDKTKEEIEDLLNYWNSKQIIVHKTLTEETQNAILKMRKKYAVEEIKQMIDRYKQVLENGKYFFNYKWSLKDFLSRKNGAVDFAEDGSKWQDYCNKTGTAVNNHIQTQINNQKKVAEGVFKI